MNLIWPDDTAPLYKYLQCVHGAGSVMYLMLRQAMIARRVVLLIDGIDDGGKMRNQIERHVVDVLARQADI